MLAKRQWKAGERPPAWLAVARIRRDLEEGRPDDARRVLAAFREQFLTDHARVAWLARKVEQATAPTEQVPAVVPASSAKP